MIAGIGDVERIGRIPDCQGDCTGIRGTDVKTDLAVGGLDVSGQ